MSRSSDSSISFGVGLLFGVIAGAAAGILFAPKTGEEMRKDLIEATDCITNKSTKFERCKSMSIDAISKVKYTLEKQLSNLSEAVKAGKMAAAKHKEELESGFRY